MNCGQCSTQLKETFGWTTNGFQVARFVESVGAFSPGRYAVPTKERAGGPSCLKSLPVERKPSLYLTSAVLE